MKFENIQEIYTLFQAVLGDSGKILSATKQTEGIVYNSNIIVGTKKKVWFGDFHERERFRLEDVSRLIDEPIYVLREKDARFDTEENPKIDNYVFKFEKGTISKGK